MTTSKDVNYHISSPDKHVNATKIADLSLIWKKEENQVKESLNLILFYAFCLSPLFLLVTLSIFSVTKEISYVEFVYLCMKCTVQLFQAGYKPGVDFPNGSYVHNLK